MRSFLAVSLVVCFAVFPVSGDASHSPLAMAEIVAQHDAETALHGHSHDEAEEEADHIFYSHAHNPADHDHNGSFLIPAAGRGFSRLTVTHGPRLAAAAIPGLAADLDKPPRG